MRGKREHQPILMLGEENRNLDEAISSQLSSEYFPSQLMFMLEVRHYYPRFLGTVYF
jgi:hypothetical protein